MQYKACKSNKDIRNTKSIWAYFRCEQGMSGPTASALIISNFHSHHSSDFLHSQATSSTTTSMYYLQSPQKSVLIFNTSVCSIISVTTYSAILSSPDAPRDKIGVAGSKPQIEGSFFWTLIKLIMFVGVCAGAFYGYKNYAQRQGGGVTAPFGGAPSFGGLYDSKRF